MKIDCTIDGKTLTLSLNSNKPLSLILRENIGIDNINHCTGKMCGLCTVLLDGKAVLSCLVPAFELNGKEVIADEVNFDLSRDDVERANRLHRLYQAIERLSEQSRKVVKLICLNNYSYADAASELGVSLATIKTHMYRSIKALRKFMALFIF